MTFNGLFLTNSSYLDVKSKSCLVFVKKKGCVWFFVCHWALSFLLTRLLRWHLHSPSVSDLANMQLVRKEARPRKFTQCLLFVPFEPVTQIICFWSDLLNICFRGRLSAVRNVSPLEVWGQSCSSVNTALSVFLLCRHSNHSHKSLCHLEVNVSDCESTLPSPRWPCAFCTVVWILIRLSARR